jgi:hypothetical protein
VGGAGPATIRRATLDIVMLALTGGRERSPAEYSALLDQSGWELASMIPTGGGVQIVAGRAHGAPSALTVADLSRSRTH